MFFRAVRMSLTVSPLKGRVAQWMKEYRDSKVSGQVRGLCSKRLSIIIPLFFHKEIKGPEEYRIFAIESLELKIISSTHNIFKLNPPDNQNLN